MEIELLGLAIYENYSVKVMQVFSIGGNGLQVKTEMSHFFLQVVISQAKTCGLFSITVFLKDGSCGF